MKATIRIAKLGEDVEFDSAQMPDASNEYAWTYGLTQSVNDATASIVRKNYEDEAAFLADVHQKAYKRVTQLRDGNVPGSRAPASPAKKLGNQVATAVVEAGVDVTKIDPAKLLAALKKLAA